MKAACFIAVLATFCFSGCSTPGSQYARAHPDLSPVHRRILITGTIPGGSAVEGMTKEQVRLAMGQPTRLEEFNGQEVWGYVHENLADIDPRDNSGSTYGSASNSQRNFTDTDEVITVFFNGDRATHTQISRARP